MLTSPSQVYSLIAQRDARIQLFLAKETIRDSKAMKTLAVITIIFLPGTFVAALFSTDLKPGPREVQLKVFAAVVIPVTVILIVAWVVWIKKNPYGSSNPDVEKAVQPSVSQEWKQIKAS
jgi:Mg2+ and Co2+ transporter CorA